MNAKLVETNGKTTYEFLNFKYLFERVSLRAKTFRFLYNTK